MKKWLNELLRPPEKPAWLVWAIAIWTTVLLGPFAIFGENWGMIFYIVTWPFSEGLKPLYEDLGVALYVGLVILTHTGYVLFSVVIVYNCVRIYRVYRKNKTDASPPTAVAS